jgi:hypothetical protein
MLEITNFFQRFYYLAVIMAARPWPPSLGQVCPHPHHLICFFDQISHKFHLDRLDLQKSLSLVNEKMIDFSV